MSGEKPIVIEIGEALDRRLNNVFKLGNGKDERKNFPHLARICREVAPNIWKRDRPGALIAVMREAVVRLPDEQAPGSSLSWQRIAETLCGFREDIPEREDGGEHTYRDYNNIVRDASYLKGESFRKQINRAARRKLAAELETLEQEVIESGQPIDDPQYTHTSMTQQEPQQREESGPDPSDKTELIAHNAEGHIVQAKDIQGDLNIYFAEPRHVGASEKPTGLELDQEPLPPKLRKKLKRLRQAVEAQWKPEAARLRVAGRPEPLKVCWSSTKRPVAASRKAVMDGSDSSWREAPMSGDITGIVKAFLELPHRQLVVLGEAGAGKSILAMLLTLGLCRSTEHGELSPVLLSASSWHPDGESIQDYIVRRLTEDYFPDAKVGKAVEALVDRGRVLLVLDGLDELDTALHGPALDSLDAYAGTGKPLVVTCRGDEYQRAVGSSGEFLSRAAVVELNPVELEQVVEFIKGSTPSPDRWKPVIECLESTEPHALKEVLASPLMASLARDAFRKSHTDPAILASLTDAAKIRATLFDSYLLSVQNRNPAKRVRQLSTLAYLLWLNESIDFVWWQLPPVRKSSLIVGRNDWVVAVSSCVLLVLSFLSFPLTLAAAVVMALTVSGMLRPLWPDAYPPLTDSSKLTDVILRRRYLPEMPSFINGRRYQRIVLPALFGIFLGCMSGFTVGQALGGLLGGAISGLLFALLPTRKRSRLWRRRRLTPKTTLRANFRSILSAALRHGATGAAACICSTALIAPTTNTWPIGIVAGIVFGSGSAFGAGLWTWIGYKVTHLMLVFQGRLPIRLWAFMADQYERDVLRRSGPTWQFRHLTMQDFLADITRHEEIERQARAGSRESTLELANNLARAGQLEEAINLLYPLADADWRLGVERLVDLLLEQRRVLDAAEVLRLQAQQPKGSWAKNRLVALLISAGRLEEAATAAGRYIQEVDADSSGFENENVNKLIEFHLSRGQLEDAARILRWRADKADLVQLSQLGYGNDVAAILRSRVGKWQWMRDWRSFEQLVSLMLEHGLTKDAIAALQNSVDKFKRWEADSLHARLVNLLVDDGRLEDAIDILRTQGEAGRTYAWEKLGSLLAEHDRLEEALDVLSEHVDAISIDGVLVATLARQGRLDNCITVLRTGSDRRSAARLLADLLFKQGRLDEALEVLYEYPDSALQAKSARLLVDTLIGRGDIDRAIAVLRARVNDRDWATRLIDLYKRQDLLDESLAVAYGLAKSSSGANIDVLIDFLISLNRVDEAIEVLRAQVEKAGSKRQDYALKRLADLLIESGRVAEALDMTRTYGDTRDGDEPYTYLQTLAELGEVERLREISNGGNQLAVPLLVEVLVAQGRIEEAIPISRALAEQDPFKIERSRFAQLLSHAGRLDELVMQSRHGYKEAADEMAILLYNQGKTGEAIDLLYERASDGGLRILATMLHQQGRVDEAIDVLKNRPNKGDRLTDLHLSKLLVAERRTADAIGVLRQHVRPPGVVAFGQEIIDEMTDALIDLLIDGGRVDEAIDMMFDHFGQIGRHVAHRAQLLLRHGRIDEASALLRHSAYDGNEEAIQELVVALLESDQPGEADSLLHARASVGDRWAIRWLEDLEVGKGLTPISDISAAQQDGSD